MASIAPIFLHIADHYQPSFTGGQGYGRMMRAGGAIGICGGLITVYQKSSREFPSDIHLLVGYEPAL